MNFLLNGSPKLGRRNIDRAIVFVTDRSYLVQTIIAASQAAVQPKVTASADILIFLIDIPEDERAKIVEATGKENFNFIFLSSASFLSESTQKLPPLHVPRATLGRLVIEPMIPPQYNHVVYLDGDIQILGPISDLVNYTVSEGNILSCSDRLNHGGKYNLPKWYLRQLGVSGPAQYFNAGILASSRSAWRRHSAEAMDFLVHNPEKCKHHDQSALNAVNDYHRDILSLEFNFNTWYKEANADLFINPSIIHFTGPMKPWNSEFGPWGNQYRKVYEDFILEYPFFALYLDINLERDRMKEKYSSANILKSFIKNMKFRIDCFFRRILIKHYIRTTNFAVLRRCDT